MVLGDLVSHKPRLALDWDGTVVDEQFPEMGDWLPGAEKALKTLSKHYEIVIHTLRVAPVLQDEKTVHRDAQKQVEAITAKLESIGLHGIEVWQRPYKPPAVAYVDDRGVTFDGNWPRIVRRLTGRLT